MRNIEKAKERVKAALFRLEKAIEEKLDPIKEENNHLKIEILKLKQELSSLSDLDQPKILPKKASNAKKESALMFDSGLISKQTSNQIDLSLSELKKLVK